MESNLLGRYFLHSYRVPILRSKTESIIVAAEGTMKTTITKEAVAAIVMSLAGCVGSNAVIKWLASSTG